MLSELDRFKPGVFNIHRDQWGEMFSGMGLAGISLKTIERRGFNDKSYKWMHSPQRAALGRLMALGALAIYGAAGDGGEEAASCLLEWFRNSVN